ncbi:hypothetical protein ACHAQH_010054 [Verticillium albo-atrum]
MRKDQQTHYTIINGGSDAVCLAWITIEWPDGNQFGWTGDTADLCGEDWYFSGLSGAGFIGMMDYEPKCMWTSSSNLQGEGKPNTGFQIHWPSYKPQARPGTLGTQESDYEMPTVVRQRKRVCDPRGAAFRVHKYPHIYTANIVGYK